jgi:hypothetical protein
MNDPQYHQWLEQSWPRPLTPEETARLQQYLATHPEANQDWQDETSLNHLLENLPAAPAVSSNFTARVMQAAQLASAARERKHVSRWLMWPRLRNWLPKTALTALAIGLGLLSYHQHEMNSRARMVRDAVELAKAVSADPQLLVDFEPINHLSDARANADNEIIALMK